MMLYASEHFVRHWKVARKKSHKYFLGIIHLVRPQYFQKYPEHFLRTCAYQGVIDVTFSENFAEVLNE